MTRYLCIHGHFYQPPRENPWLERVEREASAAPAHDWNTRILHECYHPNTCARIRNDAGQVVRILNTYSRMSFNFGPTLLHWMERAFPATLEAIVEADRESQRRFAGHGSAIAQAYNHIIMPLASYRDKVAQVRWGIADFERIFGRKPEGMWLPETAVDLQSLEVLADHGIRFTILSPRQAHRCRPLGSVQWAEVNEHTLETRRAYLCRLSGERQIAIFFYHGGLANDVAFGGILRDPRRMIDRIQGLLPRQHQEDLLAHLATDGESYGHHTRGGEEALAYVLDVVERSEAVQLTNYGMFLAKHPPTWEVEIREKTSWSCAYGVERWRSGYGYTRPEWQYEWRRALRDGLDDLKHQLDQIFEEHTKAYFAQPWEALNRASAFLSTRSPAQIRAFLDAERLPEALTLSPINALRLLEMQHQAHLMFTSCGWFFDDISNIEAQIILRHAWMAIRMAGFFTDPEVLEKNLLAFLTKAKSNLPEWRDGAHLWQEIVRPSKISDERILSSTLIRAIFADKTSLDTEILDARTWQIRCGLLWRGEKEIATLHLGLFDALSCVTLQERRLGFCLLHLGGLDLHTWLFEVEDQEAFLALREDIQSRFRLLPIGKLYEHLRARFGGAPMSFSDLISEDVEAVTGALLGEWMHRYEHVLTQSAEADLHLLHHLHSLDEESLPTPIRLALALVQTKDILQALASANGTVALWRLQQTWKRLFLQEEQKEELRAAILKASRIQLTAKEEGETRSLAFIQKHLQSLFALASWIGAPLSLAPLQDEWLQQLHEQPWWRSHPAEDLQSIASMLSLAPNWVEEILAASSHP